MKQDVDITSQVITCELPSILQRYEFRVHPLSIHMSIHHGTLSRRYQKTAITRAYLFRHVLLNEPTHPEFRSFFQRTLFTIGMRRKPER